MWAIGKKKYYFYKIVWVDPCGDAGYADVDEMKKLLPATMVSQAYIFDKNNKYVLDFYIRHRICSIFWQKLFSKIDNKKNGEDNLMKRSTEFTYRLNCILKDVK